MLVRRLTCVLVAVGLVATLAPEADAKRRRRSKTKKIRPLTTEGLPNVQSDAALVMAADGTILYAKNPDKVRAIASTGKIFVAMVVRKKNIDLDALTEITKEDQKRARGGARTRLFVGHKFTNRDLLAAMLVASDNRAPSAIGRAAGLTAEQLIEEMNVLALELGLTKTTFTDTSGLRGNESTAREMSIALRAALEDEVLAEILATKQVTVNSVADKPRSVTYNNTNKALHHGRYDVKGGKTGYTEAAGYCLVIGAEMAGKEVSCVFLGAVGKLTRFGDFNRVGHWLELQSASAAGGDTATTTTAR